MNHEPNILLIEGYYERYFQLLGEIGKSRPAWEALENELQEKYGVSRYSGFDSFVSAKNRRIRARFKK